MNILKSIGVHIWETHRLFVSTKFNDLSDDFEGRIKSIEVKDTHNVLNKYTDSFSYNWKLEF